MNPSEQEGLDHHVQTGILIEHIDTAYINRDLRVRRSIKKFGDLCLQLKGTNKVWANKSTSTFIDSIILSIHQHGSSESGSASRKPEAQVNRRVAGRRRRHQPADCGRAESGRSEIGETEESPKSLRFGFHLSLASIAMKII